VGKRSRFDLPEAVTCPGKAEPAQVVGDGMVGKSRAVDQGDLRVQEPV